MGLGTAGIHVAPVGEEFKCQGANTSQIECPVIVYQVEP
jgi:hypothetical protein